MGPVTAPLFDLETLLAPVETPSTHRAACAHIEDARADWPGRAAVSVVVNGCNWSCPYCFCPELANSRGPRTDVEALASQLLSRRTKPRALVVTGGEPTSSKALIPLLRALRDVGVPVKLDTNGTAPEVLVELLGDGLVDFVALDIKTTPERYGRLTRATGVWPLVARSIDVLIQSSVDHEMRTTCYPFAVTPSDLPQMAARLIGAKRYVLQQFIPRRTLDAAAASVTPWPADELRRAAIRCAVHVPTMVRGV